MGSASLFKPHHALPVSGLRTTPTTSELLIVFALRECVACFQVIFSADQTHELMFCLEELTSSSNSAGTDRPTQVRNSYPASVSPVWAALSTCSLLTPHFVAIFRTKTWSWPKWSSWDSPWPGIWRWLSSKREQWKHDCWLSKENSRSPFCIVHKMESNFAL